MTIDDRDPIYVDALTGLRTRRAWLELAAVEFARSRRLKRPLALATIDLNHLARVTYDWGHLVSDEVLRRLAEIMKAQSRGADLIARIDGDEFIALLPEAGSAEASAFARRVAEQCRLITADGAPALDVTCSAGIVEISPSDATIEDLLRRAREALDRAKTAPK